jgi:hypothetical protein
MPADSSDSDPDLDPELDPTPHTVSTDALVGLVVSAGVGVVGLFVLPLLRSIFGLSFEVAFGLVLAVEFVAFIGVAVSVLRLFKRRSLE